MTSGRGNRTFALALGLSLVLHVALLLAAPNPAGIRAPLERRSIVAVRLTSPTVAPPATRPEEREVELGLDAPNPPSPTWLGFAEYLKQLAVKGQIEQAAFTDDPVAAAPAASPTQVVQPTVSQPSDSPVEANESEAAAAADAPHSSSTNNQPATLEPRPEAAPQEDSTPDDSPESTESEQASAAAGLALAHSDAPVESTATQQATGSFLAPLSALIEEAREAARQASTQRQTPPPAAAPPSEPGQAIARTPTRGAASTGAQSDRESDPTSIIDAPRDQWQLGKPLAAHGLEIKPRRPEMTILTSLTAWPRNPLCLISFDRDGVPTRAVIVRSTGDSRVDSAIEASLYRWRAAGKQLESLKHGETVNLTIRLLINPERHSEDTDEPATP